MIVLNFYKVEDYIYAGEYPFAIDTYTAKNKLIVLNADHIAQIMGVR